MQNELIQKTALALANASHAIALTGAGMSTESGIRDFRGPQGLWTTDKEAEAKAYQRWGLFQSDPKAYWEEVLGLTGTYGRFYTDLQQALPNAGHLALAELEAMGIIKCVVTQNVDGLHAKAGSVQVINYHGSVGECRCVACNARFQFSAISFETLPPCCTCGKPLKYDVVHFGEPIPPDVMEKAEVEAGRCDIMLVCGTSAVVYPFAALPLILRRSGREDTHIIEINAEPTPLTHNGISDWLIQGRTGDILPRLLAEVRRIRQD